jgi:hypothetical protein
MSIAISLSCNDYQNSEERDSQHFFGQNIKQVIFAVRYSTQLSKSLNCHYAACFPLMSHEAYSLGDI